MDRHLGNNAVNNWVKKMFVTFWRDLLSRDNLDLSRDIVDLSRDNLDLSRDIFDLSRDNLDLSRDNSQFIAR